MAEDAQQKPISWLRLTINYISLRFIWVAGLGLAACQIAIWLKPLSMWPAVLEQFTVQLSGIAAIGLVVALGTRRWVGAGVFAILLITLAWPLMPRGEAPPPTDGPRLKIVSANLWYNAADYHRALQFLMDSDADVIGLVEVIPAWRQKLAPLIAKYPYSADCADVGAWCEALLLSKLPIVTKRIGLLAPNTTAVAGGDLMWGERRITVLATHLTWPLQPAMEAAPGVVYDTAAVPQLSGPLPRIRQAEQAEALAGVVRGLPPDLIMMGDWNGAPWSRVQQSFRAATGLDNHAGWVLTWPSWMILPLRLPLDHVLSRGHLVVTDFSAGPQTDSDHLPVIAEIGWRE